MGETPTRPCCLYEAALDALSLPVVIHDYDRIQYANDAVATLLKVPARASLVGVPSNSFSYGETAEAEKQRRQLVLQSGTRLTDIPVKVRAADGSTVTARADATPIRYRGSDGVLHTCRTVLDEVLAGYVPIGASDKQASDGECMHRAAFEELSVPAVIQNQTAVTAANRQARVVLGDIVGRSLADIMHPDFAQAGAERRAMLLAQGGSYRGAPAKLRSMTGETVYGVFDGSLIEHEGERAVVVMARTVTWG